MQAQAPIYKCLAKLRCFNANTKEKKKKEVKRNCSLRKSINVAEYVATGNWLNWRNKLCSRNFYWLSFGQNQCSAFQLRGGNIQILWAEAFTTTAVSVFWSRMNCVILFRNSHRSIHKSVELASVASHFRLIGQSSPQRVCRKSPSLVSQNSEASFLWLRHSLMNFMALIIPLNLFAIFIFGRQVRRAENNNKNDKSHKKSRLNFILCFSQTAIITILFDRLRQRTHFVSDTAGAKLFTRIQMHIRNVCWRLERNDEKNNNNNKELKVVFGWWSGLGHSIEVLSAVNEIRRWIFPGHIHNASPDCIFPVQAFAVSVFHRFSVWALPRAKIK